MQIQIHDHDMRLETVATVHSAAAAEIMRNALMNAGISCHVDGEHQGGFTGALAIGILVRESDLDRARMILSTAPH